MPDPSRDLNLVARLTWLLERLEDGDIFEAAVVLRELLEELES